MESYVIDFDGNISFTELISNNPDNWPSNIVRMVYTTQGAVSYHDYRREPLLYNDVQLAAAETRGINSDSSYVFPESAEFTAEESEELGSIYSDTGTYASEYVFKVLVAAESLDNFDAFVT